MIEFDETDGKYYYILEDKRYRIVEVEDDEMHCKDSSGNWVAIPIL